MLSYLAAPMARAGGVFPDARITLCLAAPRRYPKLRSRRRDHARRRRAYAEDARRGRRGRNLASGTCEYQQEPRRPRPHRTQERPAYRTPSPPRRAVLTTTMNERSSVTMDPRTSGCRGRSPRASPSTASGTCRRHPAPRDFAGNRRSPHGRWTPRGVPAPVRPLSAPPCRPRWGRVLHTAVLSRRCSAWALMVAGSLYDLVIRSRHACSAAGVKSIHSRPASPRRAGMWPHSAHA